MKKLILVIISFLLLIIPIEIFAQVQQKITSKDLRLLKSVSDALNGDNIVKAVGNNVPYFTLNIRVKIEKQNNKTFVKEITSNDSLAFKIFSRIKQLKTIDFSDLLKNNEKIVLVIPYVFFNSMIKQSAVNSDEYIKSIQNAFAPYKIYSQSHIINKSYERVIMFTPIIYNYEIIRKQN